MKPIRFTQQVLALFIAITASTCAFANNHEEDDPDWIWYHDFVVDNFAYYIIPNSPVPAVAIIEAYGHSGHIDVPAYVTYNDTTYEVTTLGTGYSGFRDCRDLTSVYIPKEIKMINNNPFRECPNLTNISVDPENKYYDSRGLCHALVTSPDNPYEEPNMLVAACKNTTIPNDVEVIGVEAFYQCHYNLKHVIIPNSVTTIKRSAFNGCNQLSTLVIGEGVSTIEEYAFADCSALQTVMCLATTPPFLRNFAFANTPVDALDEVHEIALQLPVYVPDQSIDLYKRAWPWSNFNIQPLSQANSPAYKSQWCDKWTTFFTDEDAETEEKTWIYQLGQDTTINQHAYTIVNRYSTMLGTEATKEYVAAVRFTDDKKVYIFYDNAEYLLYDFNVEAGDVIEVFAGINNYSEQNKTFRCGVHEVTTDPNTNLSTITLYVHPNNMTAQIRETKWIEGVGDTLGLMMLNGFKYPRKTTSALVCASRYGHYQYTMSEAEMQVLGTRCWCDFNIEDNAKEGKFGGRPTPTQWHVLVEQQQRHKIRAAAPTTPDSTQIAETFVYELHEDSTIINERSYFPLTCYSTKEESAPTIELGALHFSDDNKVYFHYDHAEHLLYDFGAEIGDTLEIFAGINNYPQDTTYTHVLTHKDTISDGRAIITLKAIMYEEADGQRTEKSYKKVWIAGLGSLDGIVHTNIEQEATLITTLCAWLEDECIYTTDLPIYKSLGCIYNNDPATAVENLTSPSPETDGQKFLRAGQLFILHEGKTYNVLGVVVK
jgi:hypothetical protein